MYEFHVSSSASLMLRCVFFEVNSLHMSTNSNASRGKRYTFAAYKIKRLWSIEENIIKARKHRVGSIILIYHVHYHKFVRCTCISFIPHCCNISTIASQLNNKSIYWYRSDILISLIRQFSTTCMLHASTYWRMSIDIITIKNSCLLRNE